jgi:hypothetical protein
MDDSGHLSDQFFSDCSSEVSSTRHNVRTKGRGETNSSSCSPDYDLSSTREQSEQIKEQHSRINKTEMVVADTLKSQQYVGADGAGSASCRAGIDPTAKPAPFRSAKNSHSCPEGSANRQYDELLLDIGQKKCVKVSTEEHYTIDKGLGEVKKVESNHTKNSHSNLYAMVEDLRNQLVERQNHFVNAEEAKEAEPSF